MLTDEELPFQVSLSSDPIDSVVIDVPTTDDDPILGFSCITRTIGFNLRTVYQVLTL